MRLPLLLLAALAASAKAFKDTSPFLLFSSSPLPDPLNKISPGNLQSRAAALSDAKTFLQSCPSDVYFIVSQEGMRTQDLVYAPFVKGIVEDIGTQKGGIAKEVLGMQGEEGEELVGFLEKRCGSKRVVDWKAREGDGSVVIQRRWGSLGTSVEEREDIVGLNDAIIRGIWREFAEEAKYTVIYLTTPLSQSPIEKVVTYESEFQDALHMDLKRNLAPPRGNGTLSDQRPLFEQYQFLSPGLFMGLLVGIILIAILSVGISAVASLKVSYSAFDKEMGPAAHKKQQ